MKPSRPDRATMQRAFYNKDSNFEGIFYVGVKTTGIFCRPSCSARKPRKENIEFFYSTREALMQGYRPCQVCHPMTRVGETPDWLQPLLDEIHEHPDHRFKDSDLRLRSLEPSRVRRWFKKHHGLTFQAYLRLQRISRAFGRIRYGNKVIAAAYDSGYESLSGFTESFKKNTGFSPSSSSQKRVTMITRITTPLGPMLAAATNKGICLLEFIDRRILEKQLKKLKATLKTELLPGHSPYFDQLNQQLNEYFESKRKEFNLPLVLTGTLFQKKVWNELQKIPYGTTRSYGEQAKRLGQREAVRAVARANGANKIAIIIPCHRVIGSNGKLIGYGGGLWRKQYLLNLELQNKS
jgi:AraC family transcriptional regulator of adaptative response/methylated-DNA-[protein]-cysteine methyltransferase